MRSDLFQHEVTQTCALFGRKADVKVAFRGDQAMTDGDIIYLPAIIQTADISDHQQSVMRGYVDHEAGHIRHSNMPLLMRKYRDYLRKGRVLAKQLHNTLEDVWLERRVIAEYPGAEQNLQAVGEATAGRTLASVADDKAVAAKLKEPTFIVPVALTWLGRQQAGYGGEAGKKLLDMLPDDVTKWLHEPLRALDDATCSADVFRISEDLERRLKQDLAERMAGKGKGEPDDGDDDADNGSSDPVADDGDGGDDHSGGGSDRDPERPADVGDTPEADPDSDGDCGSDGDDDRNGLDGGDGHVSEDTGGAGPSDDPGLCDTRDDSFDDRASDSSEGTVRPTETDRPEGAVTPGTPLPEPGDVCEDDLATAISAVIKDAGLMAAGSHAYRPFSTEHDQWYVTGEEGRYARYLKILKAQDYNDRLAGMTGAVNVMRRGLERALLSRQARDWDFAKEHGRLDSRRFGAAVSGRTNVFKTRQDRVEMNTALTIFVDLSGSMKGCNKHEVARDCVIALAEGVDRTGIAYEIIGFNSVRGIISGAEKGNWSRTEALDMWVFKAFEERLPNCKCKIASLTRCVGGNNVDGESMALAYGRLRKRPEKRKVFMWLSDGLPVAHSSLTRNGVQNMAHLAWHLGTVIKDIQAEGTQVVGVGICSEGVAKYCTDHVVVNDVDDLARQSIGLLGRVLLAKAG